MLLYIDNFDIDRCLLFVSSTPFRLKFEGVLLGVNEGFAQVMRREDSRGAGVQDVTITMLQLRYLYLLSRKILRLRTYLPCSSLPPSYSVQILCFCVLRTTAAFYEHQCIQMPNAT